MICNGNRMLIPVTSTITDSRNSVVVGKVFVHRVDRREFKSHEWASALGEGKQRYEAIAWH